MQPRSTLEMRVGEMLVKFGFLDEGQLELALTLQKEQKVYKPLGEICKELGFVSGPELRDILSRYGKQILLGELLLKMGIISEDQLSEALQEQKKRGGKLGQILVKKGFLASSVLIDSLCIQLGINKVYPKKDLVDRTLVNKANYVYFLNKKVIPVSHDRDKRILKVVMEDPTDTETIGDMQKMFGAAIEPAICPLGQAELVLKEIFDVWSGSR